MNTYHYQLLQAALANERGVSHLDSRLFLEALKEFVEAHRIALVIRQVLDDAGLISLTLQSNHPFLASGQAFIVPSSGRSDDESTNTDQSDSSSGATDPHYVYSKGLNFNFTTTDAPMLPDPLFLLHKCNLVLATCTYNIGLCFHIRGEGLDETRRVMCNRIALDHYNTAIETISIDRLITAQDLVSDDDSSCLLVILVNNRAVLCFQGGDFHSCEESRSFLVLWLNAFGGNMQLQRRFLTGDEITNLYRNGLLLVPPSIAGAA